VNNLHEKIILGLLIILITSMFLGKLNIASCVYLTYDIWSGNGKEDYLSVVFHFVTDD
jgi:hypothetical protein